MSKLLKKNNREKMLPKKFVNPFFIRDIRKMDDKKMENKNMNKKKTKKQKFEGFDPYYLEDTDEVTAFAHKNIGLRKVNHNHGIIDDYVDNRMENFDSMTMIKNNFSKNSGDMNYVDFKRDSCIYTANGEYVCNNDVKPVSNNQDIYTSFN